MSELSKLKKILASVLCMAMLFAMSPGRNVAAAETVAYTELPNLVQNPGFESGTTQPDNWSFTNAGTGGSWAWDASIMHEGQKSVRLATSAATDRAVFYQQYLTIEPESTYSLSAFYRADNAQVQPYITITWYTSEKVFISSVPMNGIKGATDWTKVRLSVISPVNANLAYISVQSRSAAGNIWFDDVGLVKLLPTSNLADNTSFESGVTQPDSWSFTNAGTGGSWAWDASIMHEGQKSIRLITSAATDRANFYQQYIAIEPESTYSLSAFYCADNAQVQPYITITWYTSEKVYIASTAMNGIKGADEWTKVRLDITSPVNASLAYISVQSRSAAGNVWFDDVGLVKLLPTSNLADNTGFESGVTQPDSWSFTNAETGGSWAWDASIMHDGQKSIRLITSTATDRAIIYQQYITIKPESTYSLSAFYRADNAQVQPYITITWYTSEKVFISSVPMNGIKGAADWTKLKLNVTSPVNASLAYISVQSRKAAGNVWFDDVYLKGIDISCGPGPGHDGILNADFEEGTESPESWVFNNDGTDGSLDWDSSIKYSGDKSVSLAVSGIDDAAYISQKEIKVDAVKAHDIKCWYKTENMSGIPYLKSYWFNLEGTLLGSSEIAAAPAEDWSVLSLRQFPPDDAVKCMLQLGLEDGCGKVWFDNVAIGPALINCDGEVIPVTEVEDINEQLPPVEFWSRMPETDLNRPTSTVWSQSIFKDFFFGSIEGEADYIKFTLPQWIKDRDDQLPVLSSSIGVTVDPSIPLAKAGDIQYQPFVGAWQSYSNKYYPRRMQDYLLQYNPSYILTGETAFRTRAEELLEFLKMSQWTSEGSNLFASTYFPSEYTPHPEWYGGWDYLFDWNWTDGYGYTWSLHEPDHHINSLIASTLVNSYQVYGDTDYLRMAKEFVYNQIPRYGFHKGVWNNETYYWTEYNPSGLSLGNPVNDATDNIVAFVAGAVAKVAYYETDETLKKQMLEYARGLLWYMTRELETDGRWYYNGSENPINLNNKRISHDYHCLYQSFIAMVYLYKAGVDINTLMQRFGSALQSYMDMWGYYQRKAYMQVVKIYDGVPEPNTTLKFSTFVQVTGENLNQVRFSDTISSDFVKPEAINLRISHVLSPDAANPNWTVDPDRDTVLEVTPEQLEEGVIIPFPMNKWEVFKLTYELTTKPTFDRTAAADEDSALFAWVLDESSNATFIRSTSGTTGYAENSFTLPLSMQMNINSANFLSFGARYLFPFTEEVSSVLIESAAPSPVDYIHDSNWGNIGANQYIYPIHSLLPEMASSGDVFSTETYLDKGKIYKANAEDDYVELEFETFRPSVGYTILTNYITSINGGTVKLMLDGVQLGNDYDQYMYSSMSVLAADVNYGIAELAKGKHSLAFAVTGKNAASTGYNIGLHDAIVLQPSRPTLNTDASLSDLSIGDQTIEGFAPEKLEYFIEVPSMTAPIPVTTASAIDYNASVTIMPAAELPGTTVVRVTAEDGITTRDYNVVFSVKYPTIQSIASLIDIFDKEGSLKGPLMPQLTNSLSQAEHKLDIKKKDQAIKDLEDFLKHLSNPGMT
ncbi:MAG: carbohydrate binding domain-containing protein, partial [Clostridiaceae bacterium]